MRVLFITGTDTNVGKTAITAFALAHLQSRGERVRALKPFSSGDRADAQLLWSLQGRNERLDEINPFFFPEPLAPWTAARAAGCSITLDETLHYLRAREGTCEWLLVEGAGGLLSPLGNGFSAADLIVELKCECVIVAANRLGVLNHTRLTVEALAARDVSPIGIVLNHTGEASDRACESNAEDLRLLLPDLPILTFPFLSEYTPDAAFVRTHEPELSPVLERLLAPRRS